MARTFRNESAFKDAIVKHLRANGIVCWRAGAGPYQQAGIPDIIGSLPYGRMLAIEVKMPGEKPTASQAHMLALLRANNVLAFCCDSWEVFLDIMSRK